MMNQSTQPLNRNKKLYIFLSTLIRGIGGGHIYTLNKMNFLQEHGYDTLFIHGNVKKGSIVIEDLLKFEHYCDDALQYPSYTYPSRKQHQILDHLLTYIPDKYDEYIIESQTISCSTWGELLAAKLPNCKHIVYLLGEHIKIENKQMFDFFLFKLKRKELIGIGKLSLKKLFTGWKVIEDAECYALPAYCTNSLTNKQYSHIEDIPKGDITIGYIGRTDKIFVEKSIDSIIQFCNAHLNKKFTILFIGGCNNPKVEKRIRLRFKHCKNVNVFITGIIFPIPANLVLLGDLYLATAGSCRIPSKLGITTISHDANDGLPIGIFGQTTTNSLFRAANEPPLNLVSLLDSILIKKEYQNKAIPNIKDIVEDEKFDFSEHITFIQDSEHQYNYFDISKARLSFSEHIKYDGKRIWGEQTNNKVVEFMLKPYFWYLTLKTKR